MYQGQVSHLVIIRTKNNQTFSPKVGEGFTSSLETKAATKEALGRWFSHIKMSKDGTGSHFCHTFVAEGPIIGCVGAVTGVAMVFLNAFASVFTVSSVAGTVA